MTPFLLGPGPHRCSCPGTPDSWRSAAPWVRVALPLRALVGGPVCRCRFYRDVELLAEPSAGAGVPGGMFVAEAREPRSLRQPRRAKDRLAPLSISLAACW